MKLIQSNHRIFKAFSVIIIIAIGVIYNSNYGERIFGIQLIGRNDKTIKIASDQQNNSFERMTNMTKKVIISGIKQLTSNH